MDDFRLLPPAPLSRAELATLRAVGPCRNTKLLSSIVDLQRHFVVALGGRCEPRSRLNGLPLPLHQVAMLELHLHLLRLLLMSSARACGLLRDPPPQISFQGGHSNFLISVTRAILWGNFRLIQKDLGDGIVMKDLGDGIVMVGKLTFPAFYSHHDHAFTSVT
uniref:Uncharacterized protein n=1 Tax=Brassica oleracea var. oleracea TaxID=109376 RepID=A0A0D3CRV4_BRAOL